MIQQNSKIENPEIECQFGTAIKDLQISKLLKQSNIRKKTGKSVFDVFQFLILLVFQQGNLYHFLNSKKKDTAYSKNTYYRFLNEARFNWARFITLLSTKVIAYFTPLTRPERVTALILDDSIIPRQRSKKVELLSYVYDHVIHRTVKGFNLLTLGWTDGYSFVPVGFNMMASANEQKRIMPISDTVDKRKNGYKSREDAIMKKPQAAIKLIHNALQAGIQAGYVLMDTWFTNEPFIKEVVAEGIDVIGMLKDTRQRYCYKGRLYNLKQLSTLLSFESPKNVFGSVCVTTMKHNIPVKIVFVRNRNRKNEYITILTTDCSLSDAEVVRIYGNRWKIELFFRSTKSLLCLGEEFQGLSYDMTVSSTALVFTRYILLEWLRRKTNDPKTICELFYICCDDVQDIELSMALKQVLGILMEGIKMHTITITDEIKNQLLNWFVSQPMFIQALYPDLGWEV